MKKRARLLIASTVLLGGCIGVAYAVSSAVGYNGVSFTKLSTDVCPSSGSTCLRADSGGALIEKRNTLTAYVVAVSPSPSPAADGMCVKLDSTIATGFGSGACTSTGDLEATWTAQSLGVGVEDANFTGPFRSIAGTGTFRNIACSWGTAGTAGAQTAVAQVYDVTGAAVVCSCSLGLCTTTAGAPLVCDCNAAFSAAHTYVVRLAASGDCTLYPANITCVVEMTK